MIPRPEINVVKWMQALEQIYMAQPSVTSLLFVLRVVTGILNRSLEIRQAITRPSLQKFLEQWDRDFDIAAAEVVSSSWSMTKQLEGGADDRVRKIVVNALLYSGWHEPWHELSGHDVESPQWMVGRPVALTVAMLYNQIASIGTLQNELATSLAVDAQEDLVLTTIRDVAGEFGRAAPGEPETLREKVVRAAGEIAEEAGELAGWAAGKVLPWVAVGAAVVGGVVLWRVAR